MMFLLTFYGAVYSTVFWLRKLRPWCTVCIEYFRLHTIADESFVITAINVRNMIDTYGNYAPPYTRPPIFYSLKQRISEFSLTQTLF